MSSRARKILGLLMQNKVPDCENPSPDFGLEYEKPNNSNMDSNHEVQHEQNFPVETEDKTIAESIEHFDKTNEVAITKAQFEQAKSNKCHLVPYSDSDISLSDHEDNTTRYTTTEAEYKNEENTVLQSSSSSNSCSSSSSSSSDSDSSQSSIPRSLTKTAGHYVTVDETDDDEVIENTPPQQQYLENIRNELNRLPRELKNTQSYYTSPVYTDESDIDLSDTDPTFTNMEPRRKRNYIFCQSSSSSTSSSNSRMTPKKGRKRTKNPSQWKQNKVKRLRNRGKSYISMSKTQKSIPARCLKEPCSEKCRLKCTTKINTDSRYELFRKFWDLGDLAKQRAFISASMIDVQPKYKYTNSNRPRHNNKAFHFTVDNTMIRVCKTFYKATLDISNRMIFTTQNKIKDNDFSLNDFRGRHQNHKKNDPELRVAIKQHINSIPKIEPHYVRASSTREYIEGSKTIKDLYNDFKENQQQNNKDAGTYITYYKIFTSEFNLSFFQPKKDQCDLCNSYYNSNADQKKDLEEKYNTHLEEKSCSRVEKMNDRMKVNKNFRVAVYDLEAVLQCPKGDTSSFYYKSKLNCYNLTVTELTGKDCNVAYKNVHCYFWSESDAKRGAIEIGSCVWAYLKALSDEDNDEKEVIFYSDNCCGQNKNKYITSLYLYAVQTLNIKSITHKFLIRGHTQNEADSVHSLIEREVKKNLKSGPIYTPDQYGMYWSGVYIGPSLISFFSWFFVITKPKELVKSDY